MNEKLNSKDRQVLLVTDAADPKALKAVTGLDKDGKLKTVNPNGADVADFFTIDKNGNALENFFKKFIEQSKNPSHTGFFLMSKELLDKIIKIQPIDEKMLEPYRVDPKQYLFALQEQQGKKQEQSEAPAQKTTFQPIDENKINWQQGESMGVSRQMLEDAGQLKAMLYGHKSPALNNIALTVEGTVFDTQARLSLKEMPDGTYNFQPHCYQKSPELEKPFLGATLTDQDKDNLLKNGNVGRVIELEPTPGQKVPSLVSLDKITNRLEAIPVEKLNLPKSLKGVEFTPEQLKDLKEGKQALVEGMTSKNTMGTDNPKKFDAYIQFNAAKGSFDFNYDGLNKREQKQERTLSPDGEPKNGVRIPAKLLGVDLTEKQQADLRADKIIYVTGMTDKKGEPFNAYVKVNHDEGKLAFFKWNPDKAKKVTPDNAAKTQVAANSEGKTNEATKNVKEPLKKGQTQPTEPQQKKINKSKGVKM